MSIQMRVTKSSVLYNPARDVAWNFASIVAELNNRLARGHHWGAIDKLLLDPANVSDLDMAHVADSFVGFIQHTADNPKDNIQDLLTQCEWFKQSDAARIGYLSLLGTVMMGIYFNGAREATLEEDGPCNDLDELVDSSAKFIKYAQRPAWRRKLSRKFSAAKALLPGKFWK